MGTQNMLPRGSQGRQAILFYREDEPYYGFSTFSPHPVVYRGKMYPTGGHLFQAFKFIQHKPILAEHIRTCDPRPSMAVSEAQRLGDEVRVDWGSGANIDAVFSLVVPLENVDLDIRAPTQMNVVLYHKFTQHLNLKRELLSTGNAILIENSDSDSFWGCGVDGTGRNELGKALMRLRDRLLKESRR